MESIQEMFGLLTFSIIGDDCFECTLVNATFAKDFGVFKKGTTYECIGINFEKSTITEYSSVGKIIRMQKWSAVPL